MEVDDVPESKANTVSSTVQSLLLRAPSTGITSSIMSEAPQLAEAKPGGIDRRTPKKCSTADAVDIVVDDDKVEGDLSTAPSN